MSDFLMPSLGADMESGTMVEWLVKPGSEVRKGDVVAIIETQKGAIEIEIFEDGVISELCVREGDEIPVGAPLARLTRPGSTVDTASSERTAAKPQVPPVETAEAMETSGRATELPDGEMPPDAKAGTRARITPVARRRAAEAGIDPATLKGTGIDGSVTLADVEAASSAVRQKSGTSETRAASSGRRGFDPVQMRQAIAAAMSRSKREIPHYYLASTIDMGPALAWLRMFNASRPPDRRLLPAALLLRATALALLEAPQLNGFWKDGTFIPSSAIHIGWAVSLRGGGLVAPAIRDVDTTDLPDIMVALRDMVGRARGGGLRSSELTDATFTVTSVGDRGADSVIGVINPPQVAILGFGRVADRPWVVDGQVVARPVAAASLAGDHRASDGHAGGLLLSAIDRFLQEPEKL